MAYGDILQALPGAPSWNIASRAVGNHDVNITTSAHNVVVAFWLGTTGGNQVTISETGGATVNLVPWLDFWTSGSGTNGGVGYILDTTAGAKTIRFSNNSGAPRNAALIVLEIEADANTTLDTLSYQGSPQPDAVYAQDWTREGPGFSLFAATHTGGGTPWAATNPLNDHQHDQVHRSGMLNANVWLGHNKFSDAYYVHDGWAVQGTSGGGNSTLKLAFSFSSSAALASAPHSTPTSFSTDILVNSETSPGTGNVTTQTMTLSPAPVAGNLMVAAVGWFDDPGAITANDFTSDGWTQVIVAATHHIYYKIATGLDDTSLNMQWTTPRSMEMCYGEFRHIQNSNPALVLTGEAKVYGTDDLSSAAGTDSPDAEYTGRGYLWIGIHYSPNDANSGDTTLFFTPQLIPGGDWTNIASAAGNSGSGGVRISAKTVDKTTRARYAAYFTGSSTLSNTRGWLDSLIVWRYQPERGGWSWADPTPLSSEIRYDSTVLYDTSEWEYDGGHRGAEGQWGE